MTEVKVRISKETEDELHREHFVYGVLCVEDGLVFCNTKEQLVTLQR